MKVVQIKNNRTYILRPNQKVRSIHSELVAHNPLSLVNVELLPLCQAHANTHLVAHTHKH